MNATPWRPPAPTPPQQPVGCILILRSGQRHEVRGLSTTRAKHCRRSGGSLPLRNDDGGKGRIDGRDIKQILPLYG